MSKRLEINKFLIDNEFEPLKSYEGLYMINKKGEIWSCWYNKIMKPQIEDGYFGINLRKDSKKHKGRIHRLLAIQYISNPDNFEVIDHIDRNRQNNNLENLRWCSRQTNSNNIEKGKGCIYIDKSTTERTGKTFWKAQHSLTINGIRKAQQKGSHDKAVLEEWLRNMLETDKNLL
jgi:hypothetical protein